MVGFSPTLKAIYERYKGHEVLGSAKRLGWSGLAVTFITLYIFALIPDVAEWRGLFQRLAEGILYGCLCIVSWQILVRHNSSADVKE